MKRVYWALFCIVLFLVACGPRVSKEKPRYKKLCKFQVNRALQELDPKRQGFLSWTSLEEPLKNTLDYLERIPNREFFLPGLEITTSRLKQTLLTLIKILPKLDNNPYLLEKYFDWYELEPQTFFTGYFEMDIEASLKKGGKYIYPIYGVPQDLKKADLGRFHPRWKGQVLIYRIQKDHIEPYFSRKEIDSYGAIQGKAKVIAWAKDLVDIFFLQIQGSGRLILPDGTFKYIAYAGRNGRQYISLGKYMIKKGYITKKQASLDGIIGYLKSHPGLLPDILYVNPSYVFFRLSDHGPCGAIGVKLTPMASFATDKNLIPLGTIGVYDVDIPVKKGNQVKVKGLFMAQDVGGAILDNHVDLFCGSGPDARYVAGNLSNYGKVYLLLIKENKQK